MRHHSDIAEHIRVKTDLDPQTGCWLWTRPLHSGGYARIQLGGKSAKHHFVHRLSYERFIGPIPKGMTIDHLCRNRACVNPHHLEPVSRTENIRRGASTLLNEASVKEIHRLVQEGTKKTVIAKMFSVTPSTISDLLHGRSWREYRGN